MLQTTIDILLIYFIPIAVVAQIPLQLSAGMVWVERRVCAIIQDRAGPNRVDVPLIGRLGGLLPGGLGQPLADAVKLLSKEDITPNRADPFLFNMAPLFAMIPPFVVFAVIPFSRVYEHAGQRLILQVADPGIGILFVLAVLSLSAYGVAFGGWASNSRYALLGAIRASAQMVSYEVGMGLSLLAILMMSGALSLHEIVELQAAGGWSLFGLPIPGWYVFTLPGFLAFVLFMTCAYAENNRLPFDLPECEAELVAGYHTEYSGMKFAMFMQGENMAMIAMSSIVTALFFGGWHLPGMGAGPTDSVLLLIVSHLVFMAKVLFFLFLYVWVRWTLPRFRYDQLMAVGWKLVIPLALVNLLITAVWVAYQEGVFG